MGIRGDRIRERRIELGMNQTDLARTLTKIAEKTVSQQSVAQAELKEVSAPSFALYLPTALQTTTDYLSGRAPAPKTDDFDPKPSQNPMRGSNREPSREGVMGLEDVYFRLGHMEARLRALEERLASRRGQPAKKTGKNAGPQGGRRTS